MGGSVSATSVIGEGSKFTINLKTKSILRKTELNQNKYISRGDADYNYSQISSSSSIPHPDSFVFMMNRKDEETIETKI